MTAPTLRTTRLTLGPHARTDLDDLARLWADPRVADAIGVPRRSREEVWIRLLRAVGQWQLFGYGMWVVRDTATGRFVGEVGLLEAERAIEPPLDVPETGWALDPGCHGTGMAGEAMTAALGWADARGIAATCCIVGAGNAASLRLAGRLGYAAVRHARYHDADVLVLHRVRAAAPAP